MKLSHTLTLTGVLILGGATLVHAQEYESPSSTEPIIETPAKEQKRGGALTPEIRDRFLNLGHNIMNRMEGTATRLTTIRGRLESRMNKMERESVDTSEARALVEIFENQIRDVRVHIDALDGLPRRISSDAPYASYREIRTHIVEGETLLRSAHQTLTTITKLLQNPTPQTTSVSAP